MNYALRPEWAQQRGVLLVWPHSDSDWQAQIPQIHQWYAQFIALVSPTQAVYVLCHDAQCEAQCQEQLTSLAFNPDNVHYLQVASNDTWIRDYGPLSLQNAQGEIVWSNFQFNAWGGKYPFQLDNKISDFLAKQAFAAPMTTHDWILEGGAIDVNEEGLLLTTAHCLLNSNRNRFSREQTVTLLQQTLGIKQLLMLEHGSLIGDDTDSHVDNLARFSNNRTILYCSCQDQQDPHYQPLLRMQQELQAWNSRQNNRYELVPIPLPKACFDTDGSRLPASYLNFLILNQVVIVPSYADPETESRLARQFQALFPQREIKFIASEVLVSQGGGPHCATLQFA